MYHVEFMRRKLDNSDINTLHGGSQISYKRSPKLILRTPSAVAFWKTPTERIYLYH